MSDQNTPHQLPFYFVTADTPLEATRAGALLILLMSDHTTPHQLPFYFVTADTPLEATRAGALSILVLKTKCEYQFLEGRGLNFSNYN